MSQVSKLHRNYLFNVGQHPVIEREKQVMSGESKGVTRLNKVMIAECCYRLVLKGDKKSQNIR